MPKTKVVITLDRELLAEVDEIISAGAFPNRSQAIEVALSEAPASRAHARLIRGCAKLDPNEERTLAEESMGAEEGGRRLYREGDQNRQRCGTE